MLYLKISEEGNLDKALKKLKRKFEKTGAMKELRKRREFKKKCVEKREGLIKAKYVQQKYRDNGQ
jgi:small subunit ribosomal protein S21